MAKHRNPYAAAHQMRGGAGAGAHKDRRRDIIDDLADPYGPEWTDMCPRGADTQACDTNTRIRDTGVTVSTGSNPYKPLSRDFLVARGYCCNSGCTNCPYSDEGESES